MTNQVTLEAEKVAIFADVVAHDDTISLDDLKQHPLHGDRGDDWLSFAFRQLEAISHLPPNWDSDGANAVTVEVLDSAARLLRAFQCLDVPKPHINPTRNGGVQFDWECGPRYFEIELIDPFRAEYYYEDEAVHEQADGVILAGGTLDAIVDFVRRASIEH